MLRDSFLNTKLGVSEKKTGLRDFSLSGSQLSHVCILLRWVRLSCTPTHKGQCPIGCPKNTFFKLGYRRSQKISALPELLPSSIAFFTQPTIFLIFTQPTTFLIFTQPTTVAPNHSNPPMQLMQEQKNIIYMYIA